MSAIAYKGYSIVPEGHGFYCVLSPANTQIGSCEGSYTAREIVDEHIRKVYSFYERNSRLSPLQVKAAALITNDQAEDIIICGGLNGTSFPVPERANPAGLTTFERVIDAGGLPQ